MLNDWYQQPVFSHLTTEERLQLVEKRKSNCGENIGKMLMATSLSKQPDFSEKSAVKFFAIFYFCGERDHKFQVLAKENQIDLVTIPCAGHNSHLENSKYFSKK